MPFMTWTESLSVKIPSIDEQHKNLVNLINKLHDAMKAGKAKDVMGEILQELINYTKYHFSTEEKYMQQTQYPATVSHVNEHNQFVKKAVELQNSYNSGKTMLSLEVMNFLNDWVSKHISGTDKKYSEHFLANGIN